MSRLTSILAWGANSVLSSRVAEIIKNYQYKTSAPVTGTTDGSSSDASTSIVVDYTKAANDVVVSNGEPYIQSSIRGVEATNSLSILANAYQRMFSGTLLSKKVELINVGGLTSVEFKIEPGTSEPDIRMYGVDRRKVELVKYSRNLSGTWHSGFSVTTSNNVRTATKCFTLPSFINNGVQVSSTEYFMLASIDQLEVYINAGTTPFLAPAVIELFVKARDPYTGVDETIGYAKKTTSVTVAANQTAVTILNMDMPALFTPRLTNVITIQVKYPVGGATGSPTATFSFKAKDPVLYKMYGIQGGISSIRPNVKYLLSGAPITHVYLLMADSKTVERALPIEIYTQNQMNFSGGSQIILNPYEDTTIRLENEYIYDATVIYRNEFGLLLPATDDVVTVTLDRELRTLYMCNNTSGKLVMYYEILS